MTDQELQQLAREYAETIKETVIGQKELSMSEAEQFLTWLTKTHCIVSREFIQRERQILEYDKKMMLEKPTGDRMVMAGVYQAKLELIDKLCPSPKN